MVMHGFETTVPVTLDMMILQGHAVMRGSKRALVVIDMPFGSYEGAKEVAVELYSMTKSFSMAGWRVAFMLGRADVIAALAKLKSYLDYGTFQPIQIAATVTLNEAPDFPLEVNEIYQTRRDSLCGGLQRIGWDIEPPKGTMFVWAPIPEAYSEMGSIEFASMLVKEANVAVSPGVGFGPGGDGFVRFALIENEQRTQQAVRNLRKALTRLEPR